MKKNKLPPRDKDLNLIDLDFDNPIEAFKSMIESCYAYGGLSKNNRYIIDFRKEIGEDAWHEVFDEYSEFLKTNYIIEYGVYEDSEGLRYNRLVPILDNTEDKT